jgi:hypothetical protein
MALLSLVVPSKPRKRRLALRESWPVALATTIRGSSRHPVTNAGAYARDCRDPPAVRSACFAILFVGSDISTVSWLAGCGPSFPVAVEQ